MFTRPVSPHARGIAAMFGAVLLFSACGALVAGTTINGLAAVSIASFASGLVLMLASVLTGEDRSQVPVRVVARLTVLNLLQIGLYYMALRMGPTGPVAALHLLAPVVLLIWALMKGTRSFGPREGATFFFLLTASALAAFVVPGVSGAGAHPLLALALSFGSSVAMAALIATVFMKAPQMSLQWCNGIKGVTGGLMLAPFLLLNTPTFSAAATMFALGALLSAPGLWLAWYALARLEPTLTSTIDLSEAVMTPAFAAMFLGVAFDPVTMLIMVPVLIAGALESTRKRAGGHGHSPADTPAEPPHNLTAIPETVTVAPESVGALA